MLKRDLLLGCLLPVVPLIAGTVDNDSSKNAAVIPTTIGPEWSTPILGGGVKSNGELTEGSLFLVQPLFNTIGSGRTTSGSVLFAEPYFTWGESGELGASLGLGFRHLFSLQSPEEARSVTMAGLLTEGIFIGGNVFGDYLNTASGSDFWQLGFGVEAGTRYLEMRANYYLPLSNDQTVSRESFAASAQTPGATVTTHGVLELFEEPLKGWDVEAALLVPWIDRLCDVKLIGGYYDFRGERTHISDFAGWRTGVEIRPLPAIVLHATWFESDRLYRDNWIAGVRFEIPLSHDWKKAFSPRRRHTIDRLHEPVHRQNAAITTGGVVTQVTPKSTTVTLTDGAVISLQSTAATPQVVGAANTTTATQAAAQQAASENRVASTQTAVAAVVTLGLSTSQTLGGFGSTYLIYPGPVPENRNSGSSGTASTGGTNNAPGSPVPSTSGTGAATTTP